MIQGAIPFFCFNGQCEKALEFYEKIFDAQIVEKTTYEEANVPVKNKKEIMNATFKLGEQVFSATDRYDDELQIIGNQVSIWLEVTTEQSINNLNQKLITEKCVIVTALADSEWNSKYLKFQDPFGITWELNYQK